MNKFLIWLTIAILTILIATIYDQDNDKKLPVYNAGNFISGSGGLDDSKNLIHKVKDFRLINQNGRAISQQDYMNKIYVVDFFFTRCPSICPIMTDNMIKIQDEFLNDNDVKILSVSVTPDIDSVSVLMNYAIDHSVIASKWNITTGDKAHIYDLARNSFLVTEDEGDGGIEDFIHTSQFVLVDSHNRIRGFYDGIKDADIGLLINDIYILKKE